MKFTIPDEAFVECIKFIHSAREKGGSVLVHCAQVCFLHITSSSTAILNILFQLLNSSTVDVFNQLFSY